MKEIPPVRALLFRRARACAVRYERVEVANDSSDKVFLGSLSMFRIALCLLALSTFLSLLVLFANVRETVSFFFFFFFFFFL